MGSLGKGDGACGKSRMESPGGGAASDSPARAGDSQLCDADRRRTRVLGEGGCTWKTGGLGVNGQIAMTTNPPAPIGGEIDAQLLRKLNLGCPPTADRTALQLRGQPRLHVLAEFARTVTNRRRLYESARIQPTGGTASCGPTPAGGTACAPATGRWTLQQHTDNASVSARLDGGRGCGPAGLTGNRSRRLLADNLSLIETVRLNKTFPLTRSYRLQRALRLLASMTRSPPT